MEGLPLMNSIVDKLARMNNHSNSTEQFSSLTQDFKKAVMSLKEDFLDKLAVPKVCMKQVRELVFEIEDWIDQKPDTNILDPSDIQEMEIFITEIKEARERFTCYYDLLKIVPTDPDLALVAPSSIDINPRLLVEEKLCHNLFDIPRDELVQHLTDDQTEMRKVVSVVGMEGLGKTTLANEIFSEVQQRRLFQCQAFVSIGRRPDIREILREILGQVKPWSEKLKSQEFVDVQEIITELRDHLGTKRYFVLIDGIWSTWQWKVINCALPNYRGSWVMTTTCIVDVANSCSSYPKDIVYHMEALNNDNARILFFSSTKTLQEEEKWVGFEKDSCYMLKKCDGIPLAIIVAAGLLLASKSKTQAELNVLRESSYLSLKKCSSTDGMTKLLHMSYADLSLPSRSCFLYLGLYPEKFTFMKNRLIRLWAAEGFIPRIAEECLLVTGERYFNELISKRLIQPVFTWDDDQAVGCTIHGVIVNFIRSVSREENFAIRATELSCSPFPCDVIRRYSLDCSNEDETGPLSTSNVHLSSVRSLIVVGDVNRNFDPLPHSVSENDIPIINLSAFKLLRVLDLEDTKNLKNHHLEGIGGLVLLRYLGLAETRLTQLPKEIGGLELLETLDLRRNEVKSFPASIVKLQNLRYLLLPGYAKEIWEMPKLEVALGIHIESSSSFDTVVELLRKSDQLRMLELILNVEPIPTEIDLELFLDQVMKSKLMSLSLCCGYYSDKVIPLLVDSWEKVSASLGKQFEPRRFELRITCHKRIPPNMGSLASLTHLHIIVSEAKEEDFHVLQSLTNLVLLDLSAREVSARFIIKEGKFPRLMVFSFGYSWHGLEFEGAMPQLRRLGRGFIAGGRWDQQYPDIGIEHLTCLTRVRATINCNGATDSEIEAAEVAIRGRMSEMASKPVLKLRRVYEYATREDEQRPEYFYVSAARKASKGSTSNIRQLEDNEEILEDEEQDSSMLAYGKDGKSPLESSIEDEDQMWKEEGRYSIPSNKQASQGDAKHKVHQGISSVFKKMKDAGRTLRRATNSD